MAVSWFAVLFLTATALGATIAAPNEYYYERYHMEKSRCGRVWITVHSPTLRLPDEGGNVIDAVELNWDLYGCSFRPTKIGLFIDQPTSWDDALAVFPVVEEQGYVITNVSLGNDSLPSGWDQGQGDKGPHCMWPWVAAGHEDIFMTYNCLHIYPTWMEDIKDKIGNMRLGELSIPGTHNAGAFQFDTELSNISRDTFVLCQDRTIWAQLVHGIRYFDFRVGYYEFYENMDDRYWLNHNLIRIRPLKPLLREIRNYLECTREIVFLDAHHFPIGFYHSDGSPIEAVHNGLLDLVFRTLGPYMADQREFGTGAGTKGPTLNQLWDADKRLVFSYVDNYIVSENRHLWPILPHYWANTNNVQTLFEYLDNRLASTISPTTMSPMNSAMAQTTPTVMDILFLRGSIRENADAVNRIVTHRVTFKWRRQANIVSTDFFLGSDVIAQAIDVNKDRANDKL